VSSRCCRPVPQHFQKVRLGREGSGLRCRRDHVWAHTAVGTHGNVAGKRKRALGVANGTLTAWRQAYTERVKPHSLSPGTSGLRPVSALLYTTRPPLSNRLPAPVRRRVAQTLTPSRLAPRVARALHGCFLPHAYAIGDVTHILERSTGSMHPMPGKFELAAGDRGIGGFKHGVCPPYVYRTYCTVPPATVNCGLRIADCRLSSHGHGEIPRLRSE